MTSMIQLKMNVASVKCGEEYGTAFLISNRIAITAKHVVDGCFSDDNEIKLTFKSIGKDDVISKAKILNTDSKIKCYDVAILELENPIEDISYLTLNSDIISNNAKWIAFGYPDSLITTGKVLAGTVNQVLSDDSVYDYDITLNYNGNEFRTEGISGSPAVVNGTVVGIITDDTCDTNVLGAVSISKVSELLKMHSIECIEYDEEHYELDIIEYDCIKEEICDSVNSRNNGYIFIEGVPGSGKTTLALDIGNEIGATIVGKYYINDPYGREPIQYKSSYSVFGKWLVNCIHRHLYSELIEDRSYSYTELNKMVNQAIDALSTDGKKNNIKYMFVVDGIDELKTYNPDDYNKIMGMMDCNDSNNVMFILLGNQYDILPDYIRSNISEDCKLSLKGFEKRKIIVHLSKKITNIDIKYQHLDELSEIIEGNPLYMKYIIDYVNTNNSNESMDDLTSKLPRYDGDIRNYYNHYWSNIVDNASLVKIMGIISRLRDAITKEAFIKFFSDEENLTFDSNINKVKHLLITDDKFSVYHSSFSDYVIELTADQNEYFHNIISVYCINDSTSYYSIGNKLYHLIYGFDQDIEQAIDECNQEWIDLCSKEHIDPDLIIFDISLVLKKAHEIKDIPSIVRILLLMQRAKFRNNKMFKKYSFSLAKALYFNNQKENALNYVVRNGILTCSLDEALYLLRNYVIDELDEEAELLFNAIWKNYVNEISNEKINTLAIEVSVSSISLFPEFDIQNHLYNINGFINALKADENEKDGLMQNTVAGFTSFQAWSQEEIRNLEKFEKYAGDNVDENIVNILAKEIMFYIDVCDTFYYKNDNIIMSLVNVLESYCKKFSVENNYLAATVLLSYGIDLELINTLTSNIDKEQFVLRASNGVDINKDSLIKYYRYKSFEAFQSKNIDDIVIIENDNWEEYIKSIFENVACLNGLFNKNRFINERNDDLVCKLFEIVDKMVFFLETRSSLERSYMIPEYIMLFLWGEVTKMVIDYNVNDIEKINAHLLKDGQLGLYNEGYRRILFHISEIIISHKEIETKAFNIINALYEFVLNKIENRWEKTRDFLHVIELYGRIGAYEKAEEAYNEMLKTSMGPSWYKEDQLSLLGDSLIWLDNLSEKEKIIGKILSNLDHASGELTFQRYVRDSKEEFAGLICRVFGLQKGIEYFKLKFLPKDEIILQNINRGNLDIFGYQQGYVQGANEIDSQDAMLNIIDNIGNVSLVNRWAVTEMFIQGQDRYFDQYANYQILLLQEAKNTDESILENIYKRVQRQFISEFDEKRRYLYIKRLEKNKNIEIINVVLESLISLDAVDLEAVYDTLNTGEPTSRQKAPNKVLETAKNELQIGNTKRAKQLLTDEIYEISKKGYSITNYSTEISECLEFLKSLSATPEELLDTIEVASDSEYAQEDWRIVRTILSLVGNNIDEETSKKIFAYIDEHFDYLLRNPSNDYSNYDWLKNEENVSDDAAIEDLLLWLMDMPWGSLYRIRSFDIVLWLAKINPTRWTPILIEQSLENQYRNANLTCLGIVHNLSHTTALDAIWYFINYSEDSKQKIIESDSFVVQSTYYEIIKMAQEKGMINTVELLESVEKKLFANDTYQVEKNNQIDLSQEWISKIKYEIKLLDENNILDNQDVNRMKKLFETEIQPISSIDYWNIDSLIKRSLYLPEGFSNKYKELQLSKLDIVVKPKVTKNNYVLLKKLMRRHNVSSPENDLALEHHSIIDDVHKFFISEEIGDMSKIFTYNGKFLLHYHEGKYNREKNRNDIVEVITFLMKKSVAYPDVDSSLYGNFYISMLPKEMSLKKNTEDIIPLILKPDLTLVTGSMYTPAIIHPDIYDRVNNNNTINLTWRMERNLEPFGYGRPYCEGCVLAIDKAEIDNLYNNYRMMCLIIYNDKSKLLDIGNRIVY